MRAERREELRALAALCAFCALLYGMTLSAPVVYDDVPHLLHAPLLAEPWSRVLAAVFSRRYFELVSERTYQPLVTLLHRLTGARPWFFRGLGILLHGFNAWAVFRLGRRLLGAREAWLGALLFCCFPPSTEAVFFGSFAGHLLAAGAALLAVEAWWAHLDDGKPRSLARAAGWYALAVFSKETGLAAGALCGLAWLCRGRPARARGLAALAALSLAYLALRFAWLAPAPAFGETFPRPALASLGWYLRSLVWPSPLCLEHTLGPRAWAPALAWLAAWGALVAAARRSRERLFLALWIPAALLPFLHLVAFANLSPVADRYLYLPAAGWTLLLASFLGGSRRAAALAVLGLCWGSATALRNGLFRDPRALFEQTAACAPDNPRAHYLLGMSCMEDGDGAAAAGAFRRALELRDSPGVRQRLDEALDLARRQGSGPR